MSDMLALARGYSEELIEDNGEASSGIDSVEHSDSNPSCCDHIDTFSIDSGESFILLQSVEV